MERDTQFVQNTSFGIKKLASIEVRYNGEHGLPGDTQMFWMRVFDLFKVCVMQVRAVPAKALIVPMSKKTHTHHPKG